MDLLEKIKQNGNQSAALLPEILGGRVTLNLLKIDSQNKKLIFESGTDDIAKALLSSLVSGDKNIDSMDVNLVLKPYGAEKRTAKINVLSYLGYTDWPGGPISRLIMSFNYPLNFDPSSYTQSPMFINLIIQENGLTAHVQDLNNSPAVAFTIEYA